MYRIVRQESPEIPEGLRGEDASPLPHSAKIQSTELLGTVMGMQDIRIENVSHPKRVVYFEEVVFPALRKYRSAQMPGKGQLSDDFFQKQLLEVGSYLYGNSIEEIAQQTGQDEEVIHDNIVRTLTNIHKKEAFSPDYFYRKFKWKFRKAEISELGPLFQAIRYTEPPEETLKPTDIGELTPRRQRKPRAGTVEITGLDGVGIYMQQAGQEQLLEAHEEVELAKTIEGGLIAQHALERFDAELTTQEKEELRWLAEAGDAAKKRFVTANLRLVLSIARKYYRTNMPFEDLIQEGNTGLMRAVEKFDYTKGYKFSTYATWWIKQAINRGITQQARMVRLPVHVSEEIQQLNRARQTLEHLLGHEPEPEDIAHELGIETTRVLDLIAWNREHISLDTPLGDGSGTGRGKKVTTFGDLVIESSGSTESVATPSFRTMQLFTHIDQLEPRMADIIKRRFGLETGRQETLEEVGTVHGISAERIRQLEGQALSILRSAVILEEPAV